MKTNGDNGHGHSELNSLPGVKVDENPYLSGRKKSVKQSTEDDDELMIEANEPEEGKKLVSGKAQKKRPNKKLRRIVAGSFALVALGVILLLILFRERIFYARYTSGVSQQQAGSTTTVSAPSPATQQSAEAQTRKAVDGVDEALGSTAANPTNNTNTNTSIGNGDINSTPNTNQEKTSRKRQRSILSDMREQQPDSPYNYPRDDATNATGKDVNATSGQPNLNYRQQVQPQSIDTRPVQSKRNTERSIHMDSPEQTVPDVKPSAGSFAPGERSLGQLAQTEQRRPRAIEVSSAETGAITTAPIKPSFGSILPVRTLGTFYTLKSGSYARFELTRDMRGENWFLNRGTTLVGVNRGSTSDRAYVEMLGYIDPKSKRLVQVGGEVLGSDGATGIKGKRRRMNNRWASAFQQVARSGENIFNSWLGGRNGGTTILMPGTTSSLYSSDLGRLGTAGGGRREFVEVPAGSNAYVMISDLPKGVKGVDAPADSTDEELERMLTGSATEGVVDLSDSELAELISTGTPEEIRAAMPRMNPEMRRVASLVLDQGGK